jgi:hypothetical protein
MLLHIGEQTWIPVKTHGEVMKSLLFIVIVIVLTYIQFKWIASGTGHWLRNVDTVQQQQVSEKHFVSSWILYMCLLYSNRNYFVK